jgi:hypothetical protein
LVASGAPLLGKVVKHAPTLLGHASHYQSIGIVKILAEEVGLALFPPRKRYLFRRMLEG